MRLQHAHAEPQGPFGIPGMVRLGLFSFQIPKPVLPPAKIMFSPKGFGSISSKQQGSSPDYSAKLSHQLKVCCNSVPFTKRQDSDMGRGPANSLGYRTCPVEVKAGFSAPLLATYSRHPTCASGSCKCIHWHLRLPPECCKRQLPSRLAT